MSSIIIFSVKNRTCNWPSIIQLFPRQSTLESPPFQTAKYTSNSTHPPLITAYFCTITKCISGRLHRKKGKLSHRKKAKIPKTERNITTRNGKIDKLRINFRKMLSQCFVPTTENLLLLSFSLRSVQDIDRETDKQTVKSKKIPPDMETEAKCMRGVGESEKQAKEKKSDEKGKNTTRKCMSEGWKKEG